MFSWAVGLIIAAALLRFGLAAESYAWASIFILSPITGVYYPIATLPAWLRPVSWALPPTHVFEGMRSILLHHTFDARELWWALGLNAVYLAVGYATFSWFLASARVNGTLVQLGE
jgi:ABC-2 type transport system permease protein